MKENYIIQEWCNEVNKVASISKDYKTKTIYLYTEWPGYYIGKCGTTLDKYREKLKDIGWEVKIIELKETFLPSRNYDDVLDERYKDFFDAEMEWLTKE